MPEYSHSQLSTFETCPLQYRFIYVDKIKRYEEGVEAFLGQRFHDAMEWLYAERRFRVVPLEELLDYYEKQWKGCWRPDVKITKENRTEDDYRTLGRRFIEDYYRRHQPFEEGRVLGLERYIRFPLDAAGRYKLKGIIDRLVLASDSAIEIHDYKTSSNLPEQSELDKDRQLALYQIGVQKLWPEAKDVRLVWHYVAFDVDMTSARTAEALEALKNDIAALIDRIEGTTVFEPNETSLCPWCAYWDLCPAKKHLLKVEGLTGERWKEEPGVKIVDAYAELVAKKRGLEAEIEEFDGELEKVREAAIAFADREGVTVIAGTEARLRVTGKDKTVSPGKASPERMALEEELRAAGVWDEVSTLDTAALEKAVAEGRWPPVVVERIKAYVRNEKRYTVSLIERS